MSIVHIFKSYLGSSQYIFGGDPEKKVDPIRGKVAHFMQTIGKAGSEFRTSVESEVKELKAEISFGHPHIYQDPNPANQTIDTEADPMAALRAQIAAEERAKLVAQGFKSTQLEDSTSAVGGKLQGIANTTTLNANQADNAPQISGVTQIPPTVPQTIVQVPSPVAPITEVSVAPSAADTSDKVAALKASIASSTSK